MIFIWQPENITFLHFPKTAGRTTREILMKKFGPAKIFPSESNVHLPLEIIIDRYNVDVTNFKIYTTIRNPYQMLVSLYFWIKNKHKKRFDNINPSILPVYKMNFSEYINWYVDNRFSYKEFYQINNSIPKNLNLINQDNLIYDIEKFFGNVGKYKSYYVRDNKHYSNYFTRELYDKINKKFEWCFSLGLYREE
jgi:hypothetical protein